MRLSKEIEAKISKFGARSYDAKLLLDSLYTNPVVDATKVGKIIGKQAQSVYQLIDKMEEADILKEITGADRGRLFVLDEYLKLFEN